MLSSIKIFLAITTTLLILLTNLSCHRTPVEPEKTKVNLIYEDALCTEAYFRLKTTEINYPARVDLYLNKDKVNSFTTFSDDTVFVIENLLPKKSYTSYVRVYPEGGGELVSSEVSFVTMDTTSHDFTWQVFEFGECAGSSLLDVAIIDENNIWAVGEIFIKDSLGRCTNYNAVHWNGSKWELKRILYKNGFWTINTIYAFDSNDIWFSGYMRYYNGKFLELNIPDILIGWGINKLWGTSSNDLYAVGNKGNIAHWDGRRWKKIESGTNLAIMDIYGAKDPRTGKYEILCVSADPNIPGRSQVLAIENGIVREMATDPMWEPWSIWFIPGRKYYHAGDGLWEAYKLSGPWVRNMQVPPLFKTAIRGQSGNDIMMSGAFWLLAHWNGVSWKTYFPRINNSLGNLDFKGNLVVVVGDLNNKAVVVMGRR